MVSLNGKCYATLDSEDIGIFFGKVVDYLNKNLSHGSFEGITGSTQSIVMKLKIAEDLVYFTCNAKTKNNNSSIGEYFKNGNLARLEQIFHGLLKWLFLNARTKDHDVPILGNSSSKTPATQCIYNITA